MATNVTLTTNNASTNYTLSTGARGPAGPAGNNSVTSATTSDGTAALYLDSIRFESSNGGPTQLGEMAWESNDGSIDAQLENGVIAAIGEDGLIRVRNTSGVPIAKGDALRYTGTNGATGRLNVAKWVGANVTNAREFMGFAACAMNHNANGYAQWFGKLEGINTNGGGEAWIDGQIIYAVPGTSATITDTAPTAAGEYVVAAAVINAGSGTSGSLFVRPSFAKNIASADITDIATVDLPAVNTPLSDALDAKLNKASSITITGTTPAPTEPLIEIAPVNGKRSWSNDEGWELYYDSGAWILSQNASVDYEATENSTTDEPWKLTGWSVNVGTGEPTLAIDPPDISPIGATGTRALTDRQDGKVNVTSVAGTLPVANGGTGGTNASTARTNLGLGTGDSPTFSAITATNYFLPSVIGAVLRNLAAQPTIYASGNVAVARFHSAAGLKLGTNILGFGSDITSANTEGLSRISTGLLGIGTGEAGSTAGSLSLTNLTASGTVSAANLSLTNPLSLANGGTGGTDASTARTNLGAGATGAAIFQAATVAAAQTALGWLKCTMSGNETRTNADGQTYADVSAMNSVTLAANTRYRVWGFLPVEIGGCGLKAQLVLPDMWQNDGSVNLAMMTHGSATSLTVIGFGSNVVQIGSTGTANSGAVWQFFGMIQTGSGSGTAKLQIASVDTDAGTTTLYSGAIITFELIP